jgi:hypothetical protein
MNLGPPGLNLSTLLKKLSTLLKKLSTLLENFVSK